MSSKCDVVMDLAGSYFDKSAAHETNAYIKEHLRKCGSCRDFYRQFSKYRSREKKNYSCEIPKWEGNYDEIARRLKKRKAMLSLVAVTYGVSMLAIIIGLLRRDD